jgi:hypothetical protein
MKRGAFNIHSVHTKGDPVLKDMVEDAKAERRDRGDRILDVPFGDIITADSSTPVTTRAMIQDVVLGTPRGNGFRDLLKKVSAPQKGHGND